jgi:hypothetical protein
MNQCAVPVTPSGRVSGPPSAELYLVAVVSVARLRLRMEEFAEILTTVKRVFIYLFCDNLATFSVVRTA